MADTNRYTVDDLLRLMNRLRDPEHGCPWDLAQDFSSIVPSTIEECYELADAIERGDYAHIQDELGDVLFQVVFYARLGSEEDLFDFSDVVDGLVRKLIRRHPHVFANGELEGVVDSQEAVSDIKDSWEAIKQSEREQRAQAGVFDDVPHGLPALSRAQKIQKRASRAGMDWRSPHAVVIKLKEELAELEQAIVSGDERQQGEELGDLLFTCVNMARHLELDASSTLRGATRKFQRRFDRVEALLSERGQTMKNQSDDDLEKLWQRAKLLLQREQ